MKTIMEILGYIFIGPWAWLLKQPEWVSVLLIGTLFVIYIISEKRNVKK